MSGDHRRYSDEEFALILRKAAELANDADVPTASSDGLTLTEMKAAAAQAGLDPALIERAARLLVATTTESPLDRLIGGPLRHQHELRFPVALDAHGAARLLSAVRIGAGQAGSRDDGHSSALGMAWHDGGDLEALGVTARAADGGTSVTVSVARGGTLALVGMFSGVGVLLSLLALISLYREGLGTALGVSVPLMVSTLAVARGYWAASTKRWRTRINAVVDTVGQTLSGPQLEAPEPATSKQDVPTVEDPKLLSSSGR